MPDISLKERLARDSILVAPAAFDMVSAKVIERAGFEAVYLSGFGQSASHLGLPDAGLMTLSEIAERVQNAEMTTFGDFNDLIGFPEVRAFEAKYRINKKEATNG